MTQRLIIIFSLFMLIFSAHSSNIDPDKILTFEPVPYKNMDLYCRNDSDITPAKNDFELMDYLVMSSNKGERFALITLKNTSTGQRFFKQEHIVAILGDCSIKNPMRIEQKFSRGETITIKINFGFSRFPILKLSVSE